MIRRLARALGRLTLVLMLPVLVLAAMLASVVGALALSGVAFVATTTAIAEQWRETWRAL